MSFLDEAVAMTASMSDVRDPFVFAIGHGVNASEKTNYMLIWTLAAVSTSHHRVSHQGPNSCKVSPEHTTLWQQSCANATRTDAEPRTTCEIADVTRPITAVSTRCDSGARAMFHTSSGTAHVSNGSIIMFERRGGQHVMKADFMGIA